MTAIDHAKKLLKEGVPLVDLLAGSGRIIEINDAEFVYEKQSFFEKLTRRRPVPSHIKVWYMGEKLIHEEKTRFGSRGMISCK